MTSTIISVGKGGYRTDAVIDSTKNFTPQTGGQSGEGGAVNLTIPPGGVTTNVQPPYPTNSWLSQVMLSPTSDPGYNASFYPLPQTFNFIQHGLPSSSQPSGILRSGINIMAAQWMSDQPKSHHLVSSLFGQIPNVADADLVTNAGVAKADVINVMNAMATANPAYLIALNSSSSGVTGTINLTGFTPHKPGFTFNIPGYSQYNAQVETYLQKVLDQKCFNLLASPVLQTHFEPVGNGLMIFPAGISGNTYGDPYNFQRPQVDRYDDWSADLVAKSEQGGSATVSVARGVPITWFDLKDMELQTSFYPMAGNSQLIYAAQDPNKGTSNPPSHCYFGILADEQLWLVSLPSGARFTFWGLDFKPLQVNPANGTTGGVFLFASDTSQSIAHYMSVMLLPYTPGSGADPGALLEQYAPYAYSRVTGATAAWTVNQDYSVTTTFSAAIVPQPAIPAGITAPNQTLLGLLPHHYNRNALQAIDSSPPPTQPLGTYPQGPRGALKLYAGSQFTIRHGFCGALPYMPSAFNQGGLGDPKKLQTYLASYLETIGNDWTNGMWSKGNAGIYQPYMPIDTYNAGKQMALLGEYWVAADAAGEQQICQDIINALEEYLTTWLSPVTTDPKDPSQTNLPFYYFYYDKAFTTLLGYKDGFGSTTNLNDHHFHYGYFIHAAAFLAQHDPNFVKNYGGMVDLLIADIANTPNIQKNVVAAAVPTNPPVFPQLRYWDCYEGHSWATGYQSPSTWGIQEESSSEAMNAWSGMILWGKIANRPDILQAGIYLYATQAAAIYEYHFNAGAKWTANAPGQLQFSDYGNFVPDYVDYQGDPAPAGISQNANGDYQFGSIACPNSKLPSNCQQLGWMTAVRIFAGGYSSDTDWDQYPMFRYTINWLPITSSSLHLAQNPDYVQTSFSQMQANSKLESTATSQSGAYWRSILTYPYGWATVTLPYLAIGTGNQKFSFDGQLATVSDIFDQWFNQAIQKDQNIQAAYFQFFGAPVASAYYFIAALETFGIPICDVQVSFTGDDSTPLYAMFQDPLTQKYTCVLYATQQDNKLTSITFKRGNTVICTIPGAQIKSDRLTIWTQ
jgi:hypothetical protein